MFQVYEVSNDSGDLLAMVLDKTVDRRDNVEITQGGESVAVVLPWEYYRSLLDDLDYYQQAYD